jgi:hypothetical protein
LTNLLPSEVSLDVDPGLAFVADPLVIDQMVTNLLVNARSYGRFTASRFPSRASVRTPAPARPASVG